MKDQNKNFGLIDVSGRVKTPNNRFNSKIRDHITHKSSFLSDIEISLNHEDSTFTYSETSILDDTLSNRESFGIKMNKTDLIAEYDEITMDFNFENERII